MSYRGMPIEAKAPDPGLLGKVLSVLLIRPSTSRKAMAKFPELLGESRHFLSGGFGCRRISMYIPVKTFDGVLSTEMVCF